MKAFPSLAPSPDPSPLQRGRADKTMNFGGAYRAASGATNGAGPDRSQISNAIALRLLREFRISGFGFLITLAFAGLLL
jgi:hypothetical protein